MTDDELSELEECIDDACRASPMRVMPWHWLGCDLSCGCPLGALIGGMPRRPFAGWLKDHGLLSTDEAFGFIRGFEGSDDAGTGDADLFMMGVRFRARVRAGEYAR